jgi:antitoxin YefM
MCPAWVGVRRDSLVRRHPILYNNWYKSSDPGGPYMNAVTYSQARSDLAKTMDRVCDDHSPIIITRKSQRSVVMISLEDYQALEETAYLLRSPKNARRLLESMAELQSGGGIERDLIE